MNRRTLLAATGSAALAALAGCSGSGGTATDTTTVTPTTTEESTTATTTDEQTTAATATTTDEPTTTATTATETTAEPTTTADDGEGDVTFVVVGPAGDVVFEPAEVTVGVGGTVRWEWDSGGHNIRPDSQPADADWAGTPGGESQTYSGGHGYTNTFEVPGRYDYYCAPHRSLGMRGSVIVE